jgi:hypothetical protein
VKLLYNAYPESLLILTNSDENLLHLAFQSRNNDEKREKVEYFCNQCSIFIHQKDSNANTPLNDSFVPWDSNFDLKSVICLCDIKEIVVRDKCTPSDDDDDSHLLGQLLLHLLIANNPKMLELSDEEDCLHLFLRLFQLVLRTAI